MDAMPPQISPIFPALNYVHAHLALRTMNMWLLEGNYTSCLADGKRYRDPAGMPASEAFVFRTVADDFARDKPAVAIVDRWPGIADCGDERFDYIAYFSRNPVFAEAWSHYQPAGEWGRFLLFKRMD